MCWRSCRTLPRQVLGQVARPPIGLRLEAQVPRRTHLGRSSEEIFFTPLTGVAVVAGALNVQHYAQLTLHGANVKMKKRDLVRSPSSTHLSVRRSKEHGVSRTRQVILRAPPPRSPNQGGRPTTTSRAEDVVQGGIEPSQKTSVELLHRRLRMRRLMERTKFQERLKARGTNRVPDSGSSFSAAELTQRGDFTMTEYMRAQIKLAWKRNAEARHQSLALPSIRGGQRQVHRCTLVGLVESLQSARSGGYLGLLSRVLDSKHLLIVDECGQVPIVFLGGVLLRELIAQRSPSVWAVFVTTRPVQELAYWFAQADVRADLAVGEHTLWRLVQVGRRDAEAVFPHARAAVQWRWSSAPRREAS